MFIAFSFVFVCYGLICFAVEAFLEGKVAWIRKKNIIVTISLNFKRAQFINSVNKAKYYLYCSGPGRTIFSALMNVFSSGYGMMVPRSFLLLLFCYHLVISNLKIFKQYKLENRNSYHSLKTSISAGFSYCNSIYTIIFWKTYYFFFFRY